MFEEDPNESVLKNFRDAAQAFIDGLKTSSEKKQKVYNALTGIITTTAILTGFVVGGIVVTLLTGGALTLPYILGASVVTLATIGGAGAGTMLAVSHLHCSASSRAIRKLIKD